MLLYALGLFLNLMCAVHVMRTGRNTYWIWLILFVPVIGVLAYFIVEILPSLDGSPAARKAKGSAVKFLDPTREYREAIRELEGTDSIDNRIRVGDAALALERYEEAEAEYERALAGPCKNHPQTLVKLAAVLHAMGRFEEAIKRLDQCQEHNPGFDSQDGHMIYARSLEDLGKTDEALEAWATLVEYASGEEAQVRYG